MRASCTNRPEARIRSAGPLAAIMMTSALFVSCLTGSPLIDTAMTIGRGLLGTALDNYAPAYKSDLELFLDAVIRVPKPPGTLQDSDAVLATANAKAEPEPIALDVVLLAQTQDADGKVNVETIEDGDRLTQEHNIKFSVRVNRTCHLYIISIDGSGWLEPLFPFSKARLSSGQTNPVPGGVTLGFPAGSDWFYLDEFTGVETLYFVASHEPREDLERILQKFVAKERPAIDAESAASVPAPAVVKRGFGGKRKGYTMTVQSSDSAEHRVDTSRFVSDLEAAGLVVTRWFHHD